MPAGRAWLRVLLTCALVAALLTVASIYSYDFTIFNASILFIICWGCGMNRFASAVYQSRQDFRKSQWITQIHNGIFLLIAAVTFSLSLNTALPAFVTIAAAYVLVPSLVWARISSELASSTALNRTDDIKWDEGYSIVATALAIVFLTQLERLSIPSLLGEHELATFAVLAAIVGGPFRVLQIGIRYTLLPRLSGARNKHEIRQILVRDAIIAGIAVGLASLAIAIVTPWLMRVFFAEKYSIGAGLISAALIGGTGKVFSSISAVVTTSLGEKKTLQRLNYWSWISLAVAIASAVVCSSFGLTGLVYGVSVGWYLYLCAGLALSAQYVVD
jgi:O-antigen/teichoic acid export membrane protein